VSEDERIEALEARVQEVERLLRIVVHFKDKRPTPWTSYPAAGADPQAAQGG
jgi:hypothetical protein